MIRKKLLLATTNQGKIAEIKNYLQDLPLQITSLQEINLKSFFSEKGNTFLENARGKSIFYSQQFKALTLAEDSGLEVEYLKGAPGVYSSRFSGPQATDEENIKKLLALLKDVPKEQRKARFLSCMVLAENGKIIKEISEQVTGFITIEKRGQHGFGYDPIFFYPPLNQTFAELTSAKKNSVSHRGRALKKLKAFFSIYLDLEGKA